jgi:hypothetical protein
MKYLPVFILLAILSPMQSQANDADTLIHGVKAFFVYKKNIFPPEWQQAPINAKGESMAGAEIKRSKAITAKALAKYPKAMLAKNLKNVFWTRRMSFYDVEYGGTNSNNAVYLANDGKRLGYTDVYLEQTLHHEFSSILFRNFPFHLDTTGWKAANLDCDYNDPEDGVGAIRNHASSQDIDTSLCRLGMLTQYAMSSMENDVNSFAQNLFCPSAGFWQAVDAYPRIRQKTTLLINFYSKLDPAFTEKYFRKMAGKIKTKR